MNNRDTRGTQLSHAAKLTGTDCCAAQPITQPACSESMQAPLPGLMHQQACRSVSLQGSQLVLQQQQ